MKHSRHINVSLDNVYRTRTSYKDAMCDSIYEILRAVGNDIARDESLRLPMTGMLTIKLEQENLNVRVAAVFEQQKARSTVGGGKSSGKFQDYLRETARKMVAEVSSTTVLEQLSNRPPLFYMEDRTDRQEGYWVYMRMPPDEHGGHNALIIFDSLPRVELARGFVNRMNKGLEHWLQHNPWQEGLADLVQP